uniref:ODAD1 central coiled coil region domain-containing protein n=1 Tax=Timema poppense TaxID=170557 RepID=A0A7R9DGV9_TIMPO|nr:unnamed protein product [Timema poppensis]
MIDLQELTLNDQKNSEEIAQREVNYLKQRHKVLSDTLKHDAVKSHLDLQKKIIQVLHDEKEDLFRSLMVATSGYHVDAGVEKREEIRARLDSSEKYGEDIRKARSIIKELDEHLQRTWKEVMNLRRKVPSESVHQANYYKSIKSRHALESRLHGLNVKTNSILADNVRLRCLIDEQLNERHLFKKTFSALENRLDAGRKVMHDIVDQVTTTYDERDELQDREKGLVTRSKHNTALQSSEMRSLHRKLDHKVKLREFVGTKGTVRRMTCILEKRRKKRIQRMFNIKASIREYKAQLTRIKEHYGETSFTKICDIFSKRNDENFGLHQHATHIRTDLRQMKVELSALRQQIREETAHVEQRRAGHAENLVVLAKRERLCCEETSRGQTQLEELDRTIASLLEGLERVCEMLRCDRTPLLELLGGNLHITCNNVGLYLPLIENRVYEMLHQERPALLDGEQTEGTKGGTEEETAPPGKKTVSVVVKGKLYRAPLEVVTLCPLCIEQEEMLHFDAQQPVPLSKDQVIQVLTKKGEKSEFLDGQHAVSTCTDPKSRQMTQRRAHS